MSDNSERSLVSIHAVVMQYDNDRKEWIFSGLTEGNSKVQIFHHPLNNTFRVVGRKTNDHEIVINSAILKTTKYNRATETFHQWRDRVAVYGLSFLSTDDANAFGQAMENVLLSLNAASAQTPVVMQTPSSQSNMKPFSSAFGESNNNDVNDDVGSRNLYGRASQAPVKPMGAAPLRPPVQSAPLAPPTMKVQPQPIVPTPPVQPPFVAPPPAPQPPPAAPQPPPAAPQPPPLAGGIPPPPPPPPPPGPGLPMSKVASDDSGAGGSGLAAAIAGAKLKKVNKPDDKTSLPSAAIGTSGGQGTIKASSNFGGPVDMMSEMARKLQSRKAKTEAGDSDHPSSVAPPPSLPSFPTGTISKSKVPPPWKAGLSSSANTNTNTALVVENSVHTARDSTPSPMAMNNFSGGSNNQAIDLESFKQQMMAEIRLEMAKLKDELAEVIRLELNKH